MLVLKKFAKDKPAVLGLVVVLVVVLVAVFARHLAPYPGDVSASHLLRRLKPPSWAHPFGTDNLGRDIFSRVILGARGALTIAVMVVGTSMLIGVPLGLIGGYYQGWGAETIMRVTDMFLAVPQLILALALAQLMTPSLESAMLALTLTYWPFFTRIVYAETRRLKAALFIDALQCIGASGARILFLHILPNCISPVIVRATIGMGFTILVAAVLGFLGMGATSPIRASGARDERVRSRDPEPAPFDQDGRGRGAYPGSCRARAAARAHPRRSRRIRLRKVHAGAGDSRHSAEGDDRRERRDPVRGRGPPAPLGARAGTPRSRQPHRLHPAGPLSGAQSGLQDRHSAAGGDALARACTRRWPALRRCPDAAPSRPPRRHFAAGADPRARGGARPLSAPVLGRSAPTADDRRRACLLA